jgi:hypothetical protein
MPDSRPGSSTVKRRSPDGVATALGSATASISEAYDALSRMNRLTGAPRVEAAPVLTRPTHPMREMRADEYD